MKMKNNQSVIFIRKLLKIKKINQSQYREFIVWILCDKYGVRPAHIFQQIRFYLLENFKSRTPNTNVRQDTNKTT